MVGSRAVRGVAGALLLCALAPQAHAQGASDFPADFKGRVSYSGSYDAKVVTAPRFGRRLTTTALIEAALGGNTRTVSGAYYVELEIDGDRVSGTYSGTGGTDSGAFTGTRSGRRCRLTDSVSGSAIEAECSAARFAGTAKSRPGWKQQFTMSFETQATRLVDRAEEQRRLQTAQAERERQAEARRLALANPATISDMKARAEEEVEQGRLDQALHWASEMKRLDAAYSRYFTAWVYTRHGEKLAASGESEAAVPFLRRGQALGAGYASMVLARLYFFGRGVPQDRAKARQLMEAGIRTEEASRYKDAGIVALGRESLDFLDHPEDDTDPPVRCAEVPYQAGPNISDVGSRMVCR